MSQRETRPRQSAEHHNHRNHQPDRHRTSSEWFREARQHEAEDRQRKQLIEARNQADALIYATEKSLQELGDRVPVADRERVESLTNDLKTAVAGEDVTRIRDLIEQLQQATYALSQQLYQTQQQAQSGGPQPTAQDDDVVEGEFEEI